MKKLSIIIPVYNSEKTIKEVVNRIQCAVETFMADKNYEIILVNDGSRDSSLKIIKEICIENKLVKVLNLSKNFGQAHALMAGFGHAQGDYIVCMDDDLQTPPEEIGKLIKEIKENNYDVVYATYSNNKNSIFRNFGTSINRLMQSMLINRPKNVFSSSYFIAKRFVINEILKYDNPYPYLPGLVFSVTNNVGNIFIEHNIRKSGKSNYTFKKLISLWLNGFTSFSIKPLRISTILGFVFSLIGFIFMLVIIINRLTMPSTRLGWTSMMVAIIFFGGIQLLSIGMLGEYIGRIFICINKMPQYVVRESLNFEGDKNSIDEK